MVFQNPDNQIIATIVEDDVAFGPENLGVEPGEIRSRVDESLKTVDMYDFRLFEPHNLSGGQKQRVAIAGILAMQTECILFDESTAMLDPKGREDVLDMALRLNREKGITIVFITHYMEEAAKADRIIVFDKGRIIMDGTPAAVFREHELLSRVGLTVPEARLLAERLKTDGINVPDDILDIERLSDYIMNVREAGS